MQRSFSKILVLLVLLMGSITVIATLFKLSVGEQLRGSGFRRKFYPHPTGPSTARQLPGNDYYFAGTMRGQILLGRYNNPQQITLIDTALVNMKEKAITLPEGIAPDQRASALMAEDSCFYLMDGYSPYLLSGSCDKMDVQHNWKDSLYFNLAVPIMGNGYILRVYNNPLQQNILVKLKPTDSLQYSKRFILNKQVDGFFCTSGQLQWLPSLQSIVYTYFYQNQFVLLDTNLRQIAKVRTIDTNSVAKIEVGYMEKNTKTLSTPDRFSNRLSYANDKHLYIYSGAKADNEDEALYKKSSVIDVYSLTEKRYLFSFYLPDKEGKKISHFLVCNSRLYSLQGNQLLCYPLLLEFSDH